jgi:hypothetical protein
MASNDPLGVDLDMVTDLDPTFRLCFGSRNLGNALLRRLNADAGCLESIGDDPNYGYNLANACMDESSRQGDLADRNAKVQAQLNQDERVQAVDVRLVAVVE